ncbi:MAG: Mur ligase family protein [Culicoidibacterales bacterium]
MTTFDNSTVITLVLAIVALLVFGFYSFFKMRAALHMLQQNIYDYKRYTNWMNQHIGQVLPWKEFIPAVTLMGFLIVPENIMLWLGLGMMILVHFYLGLQLQHKRKQQVKKPLVYTARVKRLIATITLIKVIIIVATLIFVYHASNIVLIPLMLVALGAGEYYIVLLANIINRPIEAAIRNRFINEARTIIKQNKNLTVIGITGSYGKTSAKNIVATLLGGEHQVLMTPESYNTPMGITITARTLLKPIHDIFIAEMGAYKLGEIRELCEIAYPKHGILTSIGPQHLESYGSIENVQKTKFELIESLPSDGLAILNRDEELIRTYNIQNDCQQIWYGIDQEDVLYRASEITFDTMGMSFTVTQRQTGEQAVFTTKLLGRHNIYNLLAAIALGHQMGLDFASLQKTTRQVQPVAHRLEMKKQGNITIIDDAFNANPVGTKMALEVLGRMPGKRIVITPGMIELGEQQAQLNLLYGTYMKETTDEVILVGPKQTQPIQAGLASVKYPQTNIHVVSDIYTAFATMRQLVGNEQAFVLLANDLPDSFNE